MKFIAYLPIKVPNNKYCWNHINLCEHLLTDGGHPRCNRNIGVPEYEFGGEDRILKPIECKKLLREVL